jgi:LuxR family maltose regulon positive regulatory protein
MQKNQKASVEPFHFKRPRINNLLSEALKYPLVIVCAGSGYGKTSAVHDFAEENQITTVWIQLSERDNVGARFLENCANTVTPINEPFASAVIKLGFPDTPDKLKHFIAIMNEHVKMKQRILVLDDFHFLEESSVIRFLEEGVLHNLPVGTSVFLISRSSPQINIASLISKGYIFNINENDLRFTENELSQYFHSLKIPFQPENIREIIQDTEGWAFAINLVARTYQKAPGYNGYVRNAMKSNIFKLMETEIWNGISEELQIFLIRLSLIEHLSFDLIRLLAGENTGIISEMEKQNAYVRRDNYISAYLIHRLFLEFLRSKQGLLTKEQKHNTYEIAGGWCDKNGFKIDALSYYEKTGDYKAITVILIDLPIQIPHNIAKYAAAILDRAPQKAFETVEYLAVMHLLTYICLGLWDKSVSLAEYYERRLIHLPEKNHIRNRTLSALYHTWGYLRMLMCIFDDRYDFDVYFGKFNDYFFYPIEIKKLYNHCPGAWINTVGSSRKGAVQEYIESLKRTALILSRCYNGLKTGINELAQGEFYFYQGDLHNAEIFIIRALEIAKENNLYEVMHRSLFFIMRLGLLQGNYQMTEQALAEMKKQLGEEEYLNRYINYDITLCWYYCMMDIPEKVPDWLKENFSPYGHAAYIENFANQMKVFYFYATRNYPPILSYIQEMKRRESYIFGKVEMLAMEACIHYKMKEKQLAIQLLQESYENAHPNELIMPFIELGKDMRTLSAFALKKQTKIPKSWLETVNRKSASYAKRQAHVITKFKQINSITEIPISSREAEILTDLSHGLSRSEIAANRKLSINTVKMVINSIYMKLGAENMADAIRIAAERRIL